MDLSGYGDVRFSAVREQEPGGRAPGVYCDHADPRVRISPELIREWHLTKVPHREAANVAVTQLESGSWVRLECADQPDCPAGDLITMNCANRKPAYRVTGSEPAWIEGAEPVTYLAEAATVESP